MCVRHIEITILEMVDVCTYMWQSAIGAQSSLIIAGGVAYSTNTKIKMSKTSRLSRAIN